MSRDYLTIGSSPANEACAQVGSDNYRERAMKECQQFIHQIRRELGKEVGSAELKIKGFPHDFGTYHEVVCYFNTDDEEGMEYAFKAERESPGEWDELAKANLGLI